MAGFEKFQRFWVKELLLYNCIEDLFENFQEKCFMWSSIQVLPNQVTKNRSVRLKILTYLSPMRKYIKTEQNSGS